jgi:4-amino-4-deoxy-L-arabinose transferase-like glycosyltransferase
MLSLLAATPLLLGWFGCFCLSRELVRRNKINGDWRLSWGLASVGFGAILTLIVEITSLGHLVTAPALVASWLLVDLVLFGIVGTLARKRSACWRTTLRDVLRKFRDCSFTAWPTDAKWFLGGTIGLVAFLFAIALATPTTNFDSLMYHLPRIMHWMQQQSVEHFPTGNSRQIEFAPWSSFAMMTLYLLRGNDQLLNLVQWTAMLSSLIVLCLIAAQLGGFVVTGADSKDASASAAKASRVTALTCLFTATLPIGVVESITTQNDYVTTFWLVCLVAFTLSLLKDPANVWYTAGAGLAFGLGVLTKPTTFIYAAPLLAAAGLWLLLRLPTVKARLGFLLLSAVAFLLLNAPHMSRNYSLFGSPLGSPYIFSIERNQRVSVGTAMSNVIRNLSLHANSGVPFLTRSLNAALSKAHQLTGASLTDPATTYHAGTSFRFVKKFFIYDSYASCTYHLLLIIIAGCLALRKPKAHFQLLWYSAPVVMSFLLFCGYLRWQQWHTRLHLAYFALLMPFVAIVVARSFPRWCVSLAAAAVLSFAIYGVANNESRPVFDSKFLRLPREDQYLSVHAPQLNQPLRQIAEAIAASNCRTVGLKLQFDDPEYPLWLMLRNRGFPGRIDHFYVQNVSARIATFVPEPWVLVSTVTNLPAAATNEFPFTEAFGSWTIRRAEKTPETRPPATTSIP